MKYLEELKEKNLNLSVLSQTLQKEIKKLERLHGQISQFEGIDDLNEEEKIMLADAQKAYDDLDKTVALLLPETSSQILP